ncbi:MAG TPA: HigA family addiction module antitoxin [Bacteroidales bacterium]|jgi:addiction module HigA family antidote|nr:HigA family addiction module antitoxin [Bacteroidales bacterium]
MITLKGIDPKMIANNLTPFAPVHPGSIIKGELEFRGISQRKLAVQMGISPTQFNEILNGKRPLSVEIALLLEAALDIDATPLLSIQTKYNLQTAKNNKSFSERLRQVREICATL